MAAPAATSSRTACASRMAHFAEPQLKGSVARGSSRWQGRGEESAQPLDWPPMC